MTKPANLTQCLVDKQKRQEAIQRLFPTTKR